jgi:hypothetical protein
MRLSKSLGAFLALFLLGAMLFAPQASAQVLDGKWFKLTCRVKAVQQDPVTMALSPFSLQFTAYLNFIYNGPSSYWIHVWSRTAPGQWVMTGNENPNSAVPWSDLVFPDFGIEFFGPGATFILSYITPFINPKLTTLFAQGEVFNGFNSLGHYVYGGISIQGKAVPESMVPAAIRNH